MKGSDMGRTELRRNGVDLSRLTDKRVKFVLAYVVHSNATQAAIDAGYSKKVASVQGCKLLKDDRIMALVGKLRREQGERFVIEADEVLEHLIACVVRDGKDFVDDQGMIHENINDLPDETTKAIDGIKQTKRKYFDKALGGNVEEVTTEIKLVSKASAIRMAMEHKGLFAATKFEGQIAVLNLDGYNITDNYEDPIQARLEQEKSDGKPNKRKK